MYIYIKPYISKNMINDGTNKKPNYQDIYSQFQNIYVALRVMLRA